MSFKIETVGQQRKSIRWVVLETGERWTNCVRRFHHELFGPNVDTIIDQVHRQIDLHSPAPNQPTIFLVEVGTSNFVASLDILTQQSNSLSDQLWLIACNRLSLSRRLVLSEFNIGGFLEQPEDILRCKTILDGYFARVF